MKRIKINTKNFEKKLANNNGFSFPEFSGLTNSEYYSTSTIYPEQTLKNNIKKNVNFYCINVDWLEIVCKTIEPINNIFIRNQNAHIQIESKSFSDNPNYLKHHKIYFYGDEVFNIYSNPNNRKHKKDEVSIKFNNELLYTDRYYDYLLKLMNTFDLTYLRLGRLDIALDGTDIMKVIDLCNKHSRRHTIQTNNDAISILPTKFNKKKIRYLSWAIGKSKSGLSATVYNKSDEIKTNGKNYITDYWVKNNIDTENVGRFEIKLNGTRLRKYGLDLCELEKLVDAEYIGALFTNEVKSWLRFYRVRKKDFLNHKKEVTLKKGSEIQFIKWNKIPVKMDLLKTIEYVPNNSVLNARNTIAFNLREILVHPNTTTSAQFDIIKKYTIDYSLESYTENKIKILFENNSQHPCKRRLDALDFK